VPDALSKDHRRWVVARHEARAIRSSTSIILILVGAALFGAAWILVGTGSVQWDQSLQRRLNQVPSWASSVLTPLSKVFSPLGISLALVLIVASCVLRVRSPWPVAFGGLGAGLAWLGATVAKAVADRPRPYESVPGTVLRQMHAHASSFPSSHTAAAFGLALALLPFLPRPAGVVALVYAFFVAWSRIYLGVHFPLDVLGGAGIGLMAGGLVLVLSSRLLHLQTTPSAARVP